MRLVIIDFNRTIYDPGTDAVVAGARELLEALRAKGFKLVMVSKEEGTRRDILERLGLSGMFDEVVFAGQKTPEMFRGIMLRHGAEAAETWVIGDHPYQEIRAGNGAGAFTIRFMQGQLASYEPEGPDDIPDAAVERLADALLYIA